MATTFVESAIGVAPTAGERRTPGLDSPEHPWLQRSELILPAQDSGVAPQIHIFTGWIQ